MSHSGPYFRGWAVGVAVWCAAAGGQADMTAKPRAIKLVIAAAEEPPDNLSGARRMGDALYAEGAAAGAATLYWRAPPAGIPAACRLEIEFERTTDGYRERRDVALRPALRGPQATTLPISRVFVGSRPVWRARWRVGNQLWVEYSGR